jgi:hypothetical protein
MTPECLLASMTPLVCAKCRRPMVGHANEGPDAICSDCAFPAIAEARQAGARAVEESHFQSTGERVDAGTLLRRAIGME